MLAMRQHLLSALLLTSGAILSTACASFGQPAAQPTPSAHDRAVTAWHNVAQCARDHGFNIPDPQVDDQGNASFPSDVGKPPEDVQQACEQYLAQVPNQKRNNGPTAEDIRLSRQLAACMRQNGEPNWPDPNADGTFPMTPEIQAEGKSPTVRAAMQACARYNPSGHISFTPVQGS
jgi:hypothetical protein